MAKVRSSISIEPELLNEFKEYGISTTDLIEKHGREAIRKAKEARWIEENREAILEYKERIKKEGTFADRHGVWNAK